MSRFYAFFSGFPTHHFPDEIAARLRAEISVRNDLVFVSAWPSEYARNDADAAGMHGMFTVSIQNGPCRPRSANSSHTGAHGMILSPLSETA